MTILLKERGSGWFYVGCGSWTPNKKLAQQFESERELFADVEPDALQGAEVVYQLDSGAITFSVPTVGFPFSAQHTPMHCRAAETLRGNRLSAGMIVAGVGGSLQPIGLDNQQ